MKKWLMNYCRDMDNHHKIHLFLRLATCRITGRDLRWAVLALLQFPRSTIFLFLAYESVIIIFAGSRLIIITIGWFILLLLLLFFFYFRDVFS